MGGGGGCSDSGHAYYLGMSYAFCGTSEEVLGFQRAGTIEWEGSITNTGDSFTAITGKRPDPMPSNYNIELESCNVKYYSGSQTSADTMMSLHTGYAINYSGTTYFTFNNNGGYGAYIGVGVTTVPQYKVKLRRTTLFPALGESRIGDDVNPIHIIHDILVTHLELDPNLMDDASFVDAAATLITEQIGLTFIMTKEKSASDWIDEILRHIDGIMYFDILTGKYTIKLMRDDYDIDTIDKVTEYNSFDLEVERKSWMETYNTVTFKYTDVDSKDMTSLIMINTASKKTIGQIKAKTIDYPMITQTSTLELVANRAMKKISYPLAAIKFKLSTIDFPSIHIGDVINLTHSLYGISDMPVRVLTLGGDKEDSTVIEVEGTEDIYGITKAMSVLTQASLAESLDWAVGDMVYATAIDTPPELYTFGNILPIGAAPTGNAMFLTCSETSTDNRVETPVFGLGMLGESMTDEEHILASVFISGISGVVPSTSTDSEWQLGNNVLVIGNEIMFFRDIIDGGGGNYTITDIIRGALGTVPTTHTSTDQVWIPSDFPNSITPSTIDYDLTIAGANPKTTGTGLQVLGTYGYSGVTPYPPANISATRDVDDITISWGAAVRQKCATYSTVDTVPAGVDEEAYEGVWVVSWDSESVTVTTTNFTQTEASAKTYTVKTILNGRVSTEVNIII